MPDNIDPIISAGNFHESWRTQLRDRFGRWIEMGRGAKFKFRNRNGQTMSGQGTFIGGTGNEGEGQFYVHDVPGLKDGFYNLKSGNVQEILGSLDPEYLKARGIELGKHAEGHDVGDRLNKDIPNIDQMGYSNAPLNWSQDAKDPRMFHSNDGKYTALQQEDGKFNVTGVNGESFSADNWAEVIHKYGQLSEGEKSPTPLPGDKVLARLGEKGNAPEAPSAPNADANGLSAEQQAKIAQLRRDRRENTNMQRGLDRRGQLYNNLEKENADIDRQIADIQNNPENAPAQEKVAELPAEKPQAPTPWGHGVELTNPDGSKKELKDFTDDEIKRLAQSEEAEQHMSEENAREKEGRIGIGRSKTFNDKTYRNEARRRGIDYSYMVDEKGNLVESKAKPEANLPTAPTSAPTNREEAIANLDAKNEEYSKFIATEREERTKDSTSQAYKDAKQARIDYFNNEVVPAINQWHKYALVSDYKVGDETGGINFVENAPVGTKIAWSTPGYPYEEASRQDQMFTAEKTGDNSWNVSFVWSQDSGFDGEEGVLTNQQIIDYSGDQASIEELPQGKPKVEAKLPENAPESPLPGEAPTPESEVGKIVQIDTTNGLESIKAQISDAITNGHKIQFYYKGKNREILPTLLEDKNPNTRNTNFVGTTGDGEPKRFTLTQMSNYKEDNTTANPDKAPHAPLIKNEATNTELALDPAPYESKGIGIDGTSDDPSVIANTHNVQELQTAFENALKNGDQTVRLQFPGEGNQPGPEADIPTEAIRDALQMRGRDTNTISENVTPNNSAIPEPSETGNEASFGKIYLAQHLYEHRELSREDRTRVRDILAQEHPSAEDVQAVIDELSQLPEAAPGDVNLKRGFREVPPAIRRGLTDPGQVLEAMKAVYPDAHYNEDGELVLASRETTRADGTRMRYDLVTIRTTDEFFYTYMRETNLTSGEVQSRRITTFTQSARALNNKTYAVYYKMMYGNPESTFNRNTDGRGSIQRDSINPETGRPEHLRDQPLQRETIEAIRNASSLDEVTDAVIHSVFNNVTRYGLEDDIVSRLRQETGLSNQQLQQLITAINMHAMDVENHYDTWISSDHMTPIEAGDIVQHEDGRIGYVVNRIGSHFTRGYNYTDYVFVKFQNPDGSWSISQRNITSRNLTIISTKSGTDGSERRVGNRPANAEAPSVPEAPQAEKAPRRTEPLNTTPATAPREVDVTTNPDSGKKVVDLGDGKPVEMSASDTALLSQRDYVQGDVQVHDLVPGVNDQTGELEIHEILSIEENPDGGYDVSTVVVGQNGSATSRILVNTVNLDSLDSLEAYRTREASTPEAATQNEIDRVFAEFREADTSGLSADELNRVMEALRMREGDTTFNAQQMNDIARELSALPRRNQPTPEENAKAVNDLASSIVDSKPDDTVDVSNAVNEAKIRTSELENNQEALSPATSPEERFAELNRDTLENEEVPSTEWLQYAPVGTQVSRVDGDGTVVETRTKQADGTWQSDRAGAARYTSEFFTLNDWLISSVPENNAEAQRQEHEQEQINSGDPIPNRDWLQHTPAGTVVFEVDNEGDPINYVKQEDGTWKNTSSGATMSEASMYRKADNQALSLDRTPAPTQAQPESNWSDLPAGANIPDMAWMENAPTGVIVRLSNSNDAYIKDVNGQWHRVNALGDRTSEDVPANAFDRVLADGRVHRIAPAEVRLEDSGFPEPAPLPAPPATYNTPTNKVEAPQAPREATPAPVVNTGELTSPDWESIPENTPINNPESFANAPTGSVVTVNGATYIKKEDGLWYSQLLEDNNRPQTGSSNEDMANANLFQREGSTIPTQVWEPQADGSAVTDPSYIENASVGARVTVTRPDGSSRTWIYAGSDIWVNQDRGETAYTSSIASRVSEANSSVVARPTFDPSAPEYQPVTVSSASDLRNVPVGTHLSGSTTGGQSRWFRKNADGSWSQGSPTGATHTRDEVWVADFIRRNGSAIYHTPESRQATSIINNMRVASSRGSNRNSDLITPADLDPSVPAVARRGGPIEYTYEPGSYEGVMTPEEFKDLVKNMDDPNNRRKVLQMVEDQFTGKQFGIHTLGAPVSQGGRSFKFTIFNKDGKDVGYTIRTFKFDNNGEMYIYNDYMYIPAKPDRGGGFSTNYFEAWDDFGRAYGVNTMQVHAALEDGGYTWGKTGFDYNGGKVPTEIKSRLKTQLRMAIANNRLFDAQKLNEIIQKINSGVQVHAWEIANIQGQRSSYPTHGGTLGRELTNGSNWLGTRRIPTLEEAKAKRLKDIAKNEAKKNQRNNRGN